MAVSVTERWWLDSQPSGYRARPEATVVVRDENGLTVAEVGSRSDDGELIAAAPCLAELVLQAYEGLAEEPDLLGAELTDPDSWASRARSALAVLGLVAGPDSPELPEMPALTAPSRRSSLAVFCSDACRDGSRDTVPVDWDGLAAERLLMHGGACFKCGTVLARVDWNSLRLGRPVAS